MSDQAKRILKTLAFQNRYKVYEFAMKRSREILLQGGEAPSLLKETTLEHNPLKLDHLDEAHIIKGYRLETVKQDNEYGGSAERLTLHFNGQTLTIESWFDGTDTCLLIK